jgi:hypothetical protein
MKVVARVVIIAALFGLITAIGILAIDWAGGVAIAGKTWVTAGLAALVVAAYTVCLVAIAGVLPLAVAVLSGIALVFLELVMPVAMDGWPRRGLHEMDWLNTMSRTLLFLGAVWFRLRYAEALPQVSRG